MTQLKATPGPWEFAEYTKPDGSPIKTVEDVAEATSHSALKGGLAELWGGSAVVDGEEVTVFYTGNGPTSQANAHLIAAAPDLYEANTKQAVLIRKAQDILSSYLPPDGISGAEAINQLLGLLDGPEQREIEGFRNAALAKARGEAS
jgi:hypothetical protein